MPTVSDFIHSSFRLIGAIAAGETLETNELNDAFISLNQLVASWNTEGLSLVGRLRQLLNLTTVNQYVLPLRPLRIDAATASINSVDSPLDILDAAAWEALPVPEKSLQSIFIKRLYCDYLYPSSTIFIWPTPRLPGFLEMWIYAVMNAFTDVNQTIDLPPGYEQALRYNFALAILPEYPRSQADPTLPAQAQAYKASIAQLNASNHARSQVVPPVLPPAPVATQGAA